MLVAWWSGRLCYHSFRMLELRPSRNGQGVFTTSLLRQGEEVIRMRGALVPHPTKWSIQIDEFRHLDASHFIDDDINHSCNPSAHIDFSQLAVLAKRDIKPGEEITIDYCATEDVLSHPFQCTCGHANCYGLVRGFRFLEATIREALRPFLSPHLRRLLDESPR
jgi:hypothetical protein